VDKSSSDNGSSESIQLFQLIFLSSYVATSGFGGEGTSQYSVSIPLPVREIVISYPSGSP